MSYYFVALIGFMLMCAAILFFDINNPWLSIICYFTGMGILVQLLVKWVERKKQ